MFMSVLPFEPENAGFNTVSGKSHILQGWDESEQIYLYIITTSVSDHEEIRGGSEFQMIRTYRFRIYPDSAQIHILESSLNLSCELYNAMLQQRIYAYRSKKKVNYRTQQNEIPGLESWKSSLDVLSILPFTDPPEEIVKCTETALKEEERICKME